MSSTANSSTPIHQGVNPSEVGWQFVPQYYTHVNQHPNRLHCFYTKNSTFIHGTEGEEVKACYGQQEIHQKILSIGFQDCKVFIHSVDAQSSQNGGIIIQVIGEMSNNGEAWRKFAQTFFLAEQPNGYFVLNDIFRFLKEETVEEDATSDAEAAAANVEVEAVEAPSPPSVQVQPESASVQPASAEIFSEPPSVSLPDLDQHKGSKQPNGFHPAVPHHDSEEHEPAVTRHTRVDDQELEPQTVQPEPEPEPEPEPVKVPSPAPPASVTDSASAAESAPIAAVSTQQFTPAPAAKTPPPPVTQSATQPASATKPAPTAPKTWAHLAASNQGKWGSQVAQEAKGVSAAPAPQPANSTSDAPSGAVPRDAPAGPSRPPAQQRNEHPLYQQAASLNSAHCFVKGVVDTIPDAVLKSTLTSRFGPIKEIEIVRFKACAFLEFERVDSAKRAIIASLPVMAGGEGGVRFDVEGGQARISIETKKDRSDRPPPRPRGGGPGGDVRGGFRGRGGMRGAGRGGSGAGPGLGK